MKVLIFAISFFIMSYNSVPNYVLEYHLINTKEKELMFINKYKSSQEASILGYVISLEIKQAKYQFFPWKKLSVFNEGKKKLEQLIKKYPSNTDLRYLRLVIQENAPVIVNYKSNIISDKKYLSEKLKQVDSSDYLDIYIKKNTSL